MSLDGVTGLMGYQPPTHELVWRPLEDAAARWAAPVWLLVWLLTFGKAGKPYFEVKPIERRPPKPNQIPAAPPKPIPPSLHCGFEDASCASRCGNQCVVTRGPRHLSRTGNLGTR